MVRAASSAVVESPFHAEPLECRRLFAGTIHALVYWDNNDNRSYDPSEEVSGPTVYLDLNNDGILNNGEPLQSAQFAGVDFNVDNGTYVVRTAPMQNYPVFEPASAFYTVTVQDDTTNVVFGIMDNAGYASGYVYHDVNANEMIDGTDERLEGMRVYADSNDNGQFDAGEPFNLTDAMGIWTLYRPAGTINVRVENTANYSVNSPASGYGEITFADGQYSGAVDFGMFAVGTSGVNGTLFVDANANGSYDAQDDTLLEGWTIYIDENDNGSFDQNEQNVITNASGEWSFSNMDAGNYTVRVVVQNGYETLLPIAGGKSYSLGNAQVVSNEIFTVSELPPPANSIVSGVVFNDVNRNNLNDAGDTARGNITVYLDLNNNGVLDGGDVTNVTDQNGAYSFGGLANGTYQVRIVPPHDAIVGAPVSGVSTVVIDEADSLILANFGLRQGAHNYVYNDFDGDGKSDVLIRNSNNGANTVWLMNGAQRAGTVTLPSASDAWSLGGTGDFNNDGHVDIVWHNNVSGATVIWLMNGATRTGSIALPNVPDVWRVAGVADWNNDGYDDIVWRRIDSGAATVWHMDGTALRRHDPFKALPAVSNLQWNLEAVTDFNGDGQADLFWTNAISGAQTAWLMHGYGLSQDGYRSIRSPQNTGWRLVATHDFNNDGRSDLLWINDSLDGKDSLWLVGNTDTTPVPVTFSRLQAA